MDVVIEAVVPFIEKMMEPLEGIEPPACGLRNRRYTPKPQWHAQVERILL